MTVKLYFGNSEYSIKSLEVLKIDHDIVAVITQPDKKDLEQVYVQVKEYALKKELKFYS